MKERFECIASYYHKPLYTHVINGIDKRDVSKVFKKILQQTATSNVYNNNGFM